MRKEVAGMRCMNDEVGLGDRSTGRRANSIEFVVFLMDYLLGHVITPSAAGLTVLPACCWIDGRPRRAPLSAIRRRRIRWANRLHRRQRPKVRHWVGKSIRKPASP